MISISWWYARVVVMVLAIMVSSSRAADWQWSTEVKSVISTENNGHPRAFLWVPPDCKQVRAVIVGQNNMLELGILEHPVLRKAMSEIGMAAVWVTPAFNPHFQFDRGAGEQFQEMMDALAEESGYSELKYAPVAPLGHSAMASYPYHFAAWKPERTLVAISIKGIFPNYRYKDSPQWQDADVRDAPLLFINGEYEDADGRGAKAAWFRDHVPSSPLTMLADVGGGHFDIHDRVIEYMAMYLKKVAHYRLPADASLDGPVILNPIDTANTGWLYERWRRDVAPTAVPAPVAEYKGNKADAFWAFDEELAKATFSYAERERGRKYQLVGYIQDGQPVPLKLKSHQGMILKFARDGDGSTLKVSPAFLEAVPEGANWPGLPEGSPTPHAKNAEGLRIDKIIGPVRQVGPDTWAIRFDRMGIDNLKRSNSFWLLASHPGDSEYKRTVQQSFASFPRVNTRGQDQAITFPAIGEQLADALKPIQLGAKSSLASQKVYYYVREGPAEVDDDGLLTFTPIPPRAKFPVKVTVVAWQWGRSVEPFVKSAEPIEQSFLIRRGAIE